MKTWEEMTKAERQKMLDDCFISGKTPKIVRVK